MAKKPKGKSVGATATPAPLPSIYYRLHSLLETIRVIKGFEDPLCTLLHAVQTTGAASAELEHELRELLEAMPSSSYASERDSVLDQLGPSVAPAEVAGKGHAPFRPPVKSAKKASRKSG